MKKQRRPKTKTMKFKVEPHRSAAMLVSSIVSPRGYQFRKMNRNGKGDVVVTFERVEE